jgi:hypothetical protein
MWEVAKGMGTTYLKILSNTLILLVFFTSYMGCFGDLIV